MPAARSAIRSPTRKSSSSSPDEDASGEQGPGEPAAGPEPSSPRLPSPTPLPTPRDDAPCRPSSGVGAATIIVLLLSERNSVREPLVLNQVGGCTTVPDQRLSQARELDWFRELNEGRELNDPGTE